MHANHTAEPHLERLPNGEYALLRPEASAVAMQNPAPQSSVEIEQLAKPGSPPKITVKVYHHDPNVAADTACQLYDALVLLYVPS